MVVADRTQQKGVAAEWQGMPAVAGMAGVLLLCSLPLVAAAVGSDEGLFFDEIPQIVTVTRLPQPALETPASVTIIDRRMIEASGAVDIPDLLRLAAGFQVGHPTGTRTTATYHGMTDEFARRMQVLVDGRSVYSPVFGGVEWPMLPLTLEDIDRIEVTRGPNGVTYGANSFLGVINIITLHPSAAAPSYAKIVAGKDDYRKAVVRQGGGGDTFDYRLTLEHRADTGLDDSATNGIDQHHDDKRIDRLSFRGEYRADVNDYLSLQFGFNDALLGDGVANSLTMPVRDNENHASFGQFGWRHVGSSEQETELLLYHEYTEMQNSYRTALLSTILKVSPADIALYLGVPDQQVAVDTSNTSERLNIELQHRYRLNQSIRAVSGVEARLDRVKASGLLQPDGWNDNTLYRLFTNGEWRITPTWLINAGVMVESSTMVEPKASPRVAANYRLNQAQSLRVSYTRAYRTPSILEERADYAATYAESGGVADQIWKSSGGLEPERIDSWEIGLVAEHDNGTAYDIKLFREKLSNLISTPMDSAFQEPNCTPLLSAIYRHFCRAIVYENYGKADTSGLEMQLGYRPNNSQMVSLAWSHLFSRKGETLRTINGTERTYNYIEDWRPEDTVTLLVEHGLGGGVSVSGMVHHVDDWGAADEEDKVSFTTANGRIAKKFSAGRGHGKFALTVNDLMGSYGDFYRFMPTTPRIYLGVEMAF